MKKIGDNVFLSVYFVKAKRKNKVCLLSLYFKNRQIQNGNHN